jgi:NitT/TauT family transport system permease protein
VPVFSAFLIAFPVIAGNVAEGMRSVDPGLKAMAAVYRVGSYSRLINLELPSVLPFFISGAVTALALSWKVVIAGEILSLPSHALGTGMAESRVMLETGAVFAWTAAALVLSAFTESLFGFFTSRLIRGR